MWFIISVGRAKHEPTTRTCRLPLCNRHNSELARVILSLIASCGLFDCFLYSISPNGTAQSVSATRGSGYRNLMHLLFVLSVNYESTFAPNDKRDNKVVGSSFARGFQIEKVKETSANVWICLLFSVCLFISGNLARATLHLSQVPFFRNSTISIALPVHGRGNSRFFCRLQQSSLLGTQFRSVTGACFGF